MVIEASQDVLLVLIGAEVVKSVRVIPILFLMLQPEERKVCE